MEQHMQKQASTLHEWVDQLSFGAVLQHVLGHLYSEGLRIQAGFELTQHRLHSSIITKSVSREHFVSYWGLRFLRNWTQPRETGFTVR